MILCDVAREDASVIIEDLKELDVPATARSPSSRSTRSSPTAAERAERAAPGRPSDAVVWEEVEARTSENIELAATSSPSWSSPA